MSSERIRAQFEPVARNYATSHFHASDVRLAEVVDLVDPQSEDLVLDVATGTGNAGLALAPHVRWVVGLDVAPAMMDEAARRAADAGIGNVTWVVGDAAQLPFLEGSFDVYVCRTAPHHFPDVGRALAEAWRVLRPGGRLVVVDCSPPAEVREFLHGIETARDPTHVLSHTIEEWRELLSGIGFAVERADRRELVWRFDDWLGTMEVPPDRARQLASEMDGAPAPIRSQLALDWRGDELWHRYWHALIRATKPV